MSIKTHHEFTDEHHKYELSVVGKLVCGGLTGAVAQTVTYPLDVVRRYMQLEIMIRQEAAIIKYVYLLVVFLFHMSFILVILLFIFKDR